MRGAPCAFASTAESITNDRLRPMEAAGEAYAARQMGYGFGRLARKGLTCRVAGKLRYYTVAPFGGATPCSSPSARARAPTQQCARP
jgi:hypothetical protein